MNQTVSKMILVISHDVVGKKMAGPGIRYYHLSRVLSAEYEVTLAVPEGSSLSDTSWCKLLTYRDEHDDSIVAAIDHASVVIIPAIWAEHIADLLTSACVVIDGYDPFIAETLALGRGGTDNLLQTLTQATLIGDFFLCASERQRDWWLGLLEANGRVNTHTFAEDASLRALVDVVPYGLPGTVPHRSRPVVKGVWPGVGPDDTVILWGGGLWPWLDPLTGIRAVAKIWQQRQDVRLIFPGTKHPNPGMVGIPTHVENARQVAREKGLVNKAVFFGDWVAYEDWPAVLLESDLALTLHYDTLEARLAFRSRVLDYIWAGLPTVATKGDATSDLLSKHGLGIPVDYESVEGVEKAILELLDAPFDKFYGRFEFVRTMFTWEKAAAPLLEFCRQPRKAPDKVALGADLGNPFYITYQRKLDDEREHWRGLVRQYEQGRFIRFMRWFHQAFQIMQGNNE
jgi:glycosyltransferase involved in cell wall biosynthesis